MANPDDVVDAELVGDVNDPHSDPSGTLGIGESGDSSPVETTLEQPPYGVDKYLMPSERRTAIIWTREHWITLAAPAAAAAGGLALAAGLNAWAYAKWNGTADPAPGVLVVRVTWFAYAVILLWAVARYASWRVCWFVVTGARIFQTSGILTRKTTPLPMARIRDIEVSQTLLGRWLDYGTLECESIATDHALHQIPFIPGAVDIHVAISSKLMSRPFTGITPDPW